MKLKLSSFACSLFALAAFCCGAVHGELLFRAGFDGGKFTADTFAGAAGGSTTFQDDTFESFKVEGVGGNGSAVAVDSSKAIVYPAEGNINWKKGTVSFWMSARNWAPGSKHFQVIFEARMPDENNRILIYKYHENSTLRFLLQAGGQEVGYVAIPMKDAEWADGAWHKVDAAWDQEQMQLFLDGKPNMQVQYTKNPVVFRAPFKMPGGKGTIRLGVNPGFRHEKSDVIGYDEVRIYDTMLTPAEVAKNFADEAAGKFELAAPAAKKAESGEAQRDDESLKDPSLLFKASFDNITVTADKGNGGKKSTNFIPDTLMLRMHPGVSEIGNALTLNNRENVVYPTEGNFNYRKGTISLWVASKNWLPDKKKFQIFFQAWFSQDTRFLVYKFVDPGYLRFVIIVKGKEIGNINIPLKNSEWQPGMWHKIDVTWDEKSMAVYLDGNIAKQQPYTRNPYNFPHPIDYPANLKGHGMHLGIDKSFGHDADDVTAFDELEIYDRILSPAEIRTNYEKFIKPVNDGSNPPMVTVPGGKPVTIDGKLDEAEWSDAAIIPVVNKVKRDFHPEVNAKVYLKQNGGNLLVGAELTGGEQASITGDDLVDIWRDDAFEIHLLTSNKKRYQFIINSLGALFDGTVNRDDGFYEQAKLTNAWNSGAVTKTSRGNGKWFVEMSISKEKMGVINDEIRGNFCATRYMDKGYHVAWGMNAQNFYDAESFGIIKFSESAKPVRFETYSPYRGHFVLNPEAALNIQIAGSKNIKRPANTRDWKLELSSGVYDLTAKGAGYNFISRFTVDQPLVVTYQCFASRKTLEVKADLSAATGDIRKAIPAGTLKGKVQLIDADGTAHQSIDFTPIDFNTIVKVPLPEMPQGTYQVVVTVDNGSGSAISAQKRFRVPDMTPYKLKVADDHTVPYPWTPVKQLGSREFQVWNRTYTFGNGPFPVQIVSDGAKLLKAGPDFHLDGKPVTWKGFKITEKHDDYYRFEGTGAAGNLTFRWISDLCFDGLVKIKVFMSPAKGSADISDLRLKWSVPAEFARAALDPLHVPYSNRDGEVYRFPYSHGQDFIIWTMGIEKGFLYWPHSSANWNNPAGHKQFSFTRKGDTVHINADYITKKATLTKEAEYSMVFQATPQRPEPPRRRDFNVGQIWDFLKYETLKMQYFGITTDPIHPAATEPWTGLKPNNPETFAAHIKDIEAKGSRYMPYSQPAHTCNAEESYDYFFPEWRQKPGFPVGGGVSLKTGQYYEPEATCAHTGAGDLFVYRADKLLTDFPDLPGLYYDICEGRLCWNNLHGCGGVDAFGKEYGTSNLLIHRDYFIRIKRVVVNHGKDKILFLHAHNRFIPFCHGLADYWYPGEQYADPITGNLEHFFCESIPLQEYQSAYYTPTRGTGIVFMAVYQITQWRLKLKGDYTQPKYAFSFLTPVILHDMGLTNSYVNHKVVEKWWIIKHDIDLAAAKFHGYWFSDAAKSASPKVYVSWFSWDKPSPYKRMLAVGNMGRTEQPAALTLNEKELGINLKKDKLYNLWTGEEITDLKKLTVQPNNFVLIGIK